MGFKEQVEKNDMKIVPLLIGNITEKSKRIIDWIYQRQIHPSETQPLCNYLNDKAQCDHMITSIFEHIDAKIDQVLETLLLNESTRQTEKFDYNRLSCPTVKQLLDISKTETRKLPIKRRRHTRQE